MTTARLPSATVQRPSVCYFRREHKKSGRSFEQCWFSAGYCLPLLPLDLFCVQRLRWLSGACLHHQLICSWLVWTACRLQLLGTLHLVGTMQKLAGLSWPSCSGRPQHDFCDQETAGTWEEGKGLPQGCPPLPLRAGALWGYGCRPSLPDQAPPELHRGLTLHLAAACASPAAVQVARSGVSCSGAPRWWCSVRVGAVMGGRRTRAPHMQLNRSRQAASTISNPCCEHASTGQHQPISSLHMWQLVAQCSQWQAAATEAMGWTRQ